jgi:hypothetical protein
MVSLPWQRVAGFGGGHRVMLLFAKAIWPTRGALARKEKARSDAEKFKIQSSKSKEIPNSHPV